MSSWLIAMMAVAPICSAASTVSEKSLHRMEEVVVTATRIETAAHDVAANITVINKADIEKMPVSNVAEVLQYIPGVYMEFHGGLGSDASGVRIQGSETRHVAIYQDGVPLNQLANPLTDLSYLPINSVERIEVYKGAASSAWGSALGGVINIITKEPAPAKPISGDVRVSYGGFQTLKSRGSVSGTVNRFGYLLTVTRDETDGFIDNTEYQQDAVYAKVNYDFSDTSRINFVYSFDEGRNADPLPNFADFWDDNQRRRSYQRISLETSPADAFDLTLEGRHHSWDNHIDDVFAAGRVVFNDYKDEIWGLSARANYEATQANTLNLGFDADWGSYDWINYTREYTTQNWALYANDTHIWGNFSFNLGLRYDDNSTFGGALSPSGGVVYRFLENKALIRAQIAKGFSAPPASWVHDPNFGNPDLSPETAINYQMGGEWQPFKLLRFEVNLFRADVEDLIRFNFTTRRFENIDQVRRQGVEGNINLHFDFGLNLSFGGSYVDVKDTQTDAVIENIPRTIYNIKAIYTYQWMTHSIIGKYIDHNSSFPETKDGVFVFDYYGQIKLPVLKNYGLLSLFGAVYNIAGANYIYRNVWPQPGRWVEGGIRFGF